MTRRIIYKTADDLLDRCTTHADCYVWPESSCSVPSLGPESPMTKIFRTTSVVRILFILCKYIPVGRRLVRHCPTHFCVNPFHYTESKRLMAKRAKLPDPNGLTLEQMIDREKIAPPDEELEKMRPSNPAHVKRLMNAASVAGYDCEGIGNDRRYKPPKKKVIRTAKDNEPVLVMKNYEPPREIEPAKPISDEDWEELERPFRKQDSLPEVVDEIDHNVEHPELTNDIFEMIKRRKEWEEHKQKS